MKADKPTYEELEARLAGAERAVRAIRNEEIDAFIGRKGVHLLRIRELEEKLKQSNLELTEYAYAMTHNLKEPLRAIHHYTDFLFEDLADRLSGEQKNYLLGLHRAIVQCNKQIRDLETLYGIKSDPLNLEEFDLTEILAEMACIFGDKPDRRLSFPERWPAVNSERFIFRQILFHLVGNGFEYNQSPLKTVAVGFQRRGGGRFEIFVSDNGIGIEPEYQEQIFHIFRRLHTEREYEGTGIGLAIVKKAAQRVEGTLRIESRPGEGSTFYVDLPASIVAGRDRH